MDASTPLIKEHVAEVCRALTARWLSACICQVLH